MVKDALRLMEKLNELKESLQFPASRQRTKSATFWACFSWEHEQRAGCLGCLCVLTLTYEMYLLTEDLISSSHLISCNELYLDACVEPDSKHPV